MNESAAPHAPTRSQAQIPSPLYAIAGIFSVQFGNAIVGSLFGGVGPLGAAALRLGFASLILLLAVRPRVRGWSRRTWAWTVALGLGMGGMNVCIYFAIEQIPLGVAVTIELMGPLAVAAFGTRRLADWAWVLLALAGIVLLGLERGSGAGGAAGVATVTLAGALFAAAAACFWATYIWASPCSRR